jgi:UDP-glucose 4-epimerase
MRVLVTGGAGFLGSHVADALSSAGHQVTIFDRRPSPYLRPDQEMITGDLQDVPAVTAAMHQQEAVYHLAGFADLNRARHEPLATVRENVLGTAQLLEAAREAGLKRFVFASTIYVFSRLGGFYRCSKQSAELYVEEYQRRYGLDFTILRFGTLYGPRADETNSIWRYLRSALARRRIDYPGSGEEVREYIHVRDAGRLCVEVLEARYANQHIIVTGHQAIRARDLLLTIREIFQGKVEVCFQPSEDDAHYTITPYAFMPQVGHKLVSNFYVDMGQGLLECLQELTRSEGVDAAAAAPAGPPARGQSA